MSVLTETVRLLRAALAQEPGVSDVWCKVLPDDIVERLIHIIQVFLNFYVHFLMDIIYQAF